MHRYGPNAFQLHRLPTPRLGTVLGLVGTNGIGKSTALRILANKLKPNLGLFDNAPDWKAIVTHFRGSELQSYLQRVVENDLKTIVKPQHVDALRKLKIQKVNDLLNQKDERKLKDHYCELLELTHILDRDLVNLSGGELQRFAIAAVCNQIADVYMFDEPSSYLDIKQRMAVAATIRGMCSAHNYCIVVEHDLSVLDYMSDHICCLYGKPGAYGVVTLPFAVREGINVFLSGFVPTENMRFRDDELTFHIADDVDDKKANPHSVSSVRHTWQHMQKTFDAFQLAVEPGDMRHSEVLVLLGENGTGKTTFVRMLAGMQCADEEQSIPTLHVSYKPQNIVPKFPGTVRQLLHTKIRCTYTSPVFETDVMRPLNIADLFDRDVNTLSGGELQRVALTLCLGKSAHVYLIDEPSAYLDAEQRIVCAKVIKRFVMSTKATAFVVEHDFIMATYLADRVIVFSGQPSVRCTAHSPQTVVSGMNRFLQHLQITYRRDPTNNRPRINKSQSIKDQEQKKSGNYFFMDISQDDA